MPILVTLIYLDIILCKILGSTDSTMNCQQWEYSIMSFIDVLLTLLSKQT